MDTKLTLKLDKDIIDKAKIFAKKRNISLSKMIEHYLDYLLKSKDSDEYSMLVNELSGIIKLPKDYNLKEDYTDYLVTKHNI
jgi:hypothetical protein